MRIKLQAYYNSLSQRERLLVLGGVLVLAPLFLTHLVIKPVVAQFSQQSTALAQIESDIKTLPFILDRYQKFASKKADIESEFKQVEIKEGEQSLLENILSGKVDAGFDITPGQTRAFGGSYEQAAVTVRFSTSSLSTLVVTWTALDTPSESLLYFFERQNYHCWLL